VHRPLLVCSIGNVPLAAVLWNGGISFGGVIAFIFADLIVLPILNIYRKYYGWRMMFRYSGTPWSDDCKTSSRFGQDVQVSSVDAPNARPRDFFTSFHDRRTSLSCKHLANERSICGWLWATRRGTRGVNHALETALPGRQQHLLAN